MIPMAYLNENFMDCDENLAWGKQEPLIHSYMFWYTTKGEKVATTPFYNRKISMIFPLVSCFSCVNNPSSS